MNFGLVYFLKDLLHKIDKKITVFNISGRFSTWSIFATVQCRSKLLHFEGNFFTMIFKVTIYIICFKDWIALSANAAFVSLIVEQFSMSSSSQNFLKVPPYSVPLSTQIFQECFFEKWFFWKHVKCFWHTLILLFELWQISKKYLQQLRDNWLYLKNFLLFFDKPLALLKFWKEPYAALPL